MRLSVIKVPTRSLLNEKDANTRERIATARAPAQQRTHKKDGRADSPRNKNVRDMTQHLTKDMSQLNSRLEPFFSEAHLQFLFRFSRLGRAFCGRLQFLGGLLSSLATLPSLGYTLPFGCLFAKFSCASSFWWAPPVRPGYTVSFRSHPSSSEILSFLFVSPKPRRSSLEFYRQRSPRLLTFPAKENFPKETRNSTRTFTVYYVLCFVHELLSHYSFCVILCAQLVCVFVVLSFEGHIFCFFERTSLKTSSALFLTARRGLPVRKSLKRRDWVLSLSQISPWVSRMRQGRGCRPTCFCIPVPRHGHHSKELTNSNSNHTPFWKKCVCLFLLESTKLQLYWALSVLGANDVENFKEW